MAAAARRRSTTTVDPFLPQLTERLSNLTRAGFDATLLVRSAAAAGPLPTTIPPPPSSGASSISYPRKCRTKALQSPTPSQRAGTLARGHTTTSHPGRARRRLPHSAQAAENLAMTTPEMCSTGSVCGNPFQSVSRGLAALGLRSACHRLLCGPLRHGEEMRWEPWMTRCRSTAGTGSRCLICKASE